MNTIHLEARRGHRWYPMLYSLPMEPYKIKVVEPLHFTTREEREQLLEAAGYNLFQIPGKKVLIDLLTDSGTSAMSDQQWSGMMLGDESYAGSENFYHLEEAVREIFGYPYVIPTHQGRVAEHLLFSTLLKPGDGVPSNAHFDTTRANIEHCGAIAQNCVIDEGLDPQANHPFKGNISLEKLEHFIQTMGRDRVPLCMLTITNNSGGGQPVSLENIRAVRELLNRYEIPLIFDACRFAENAYFIQTREVGYTDWSIEAIVREIFRHGDGCTMSAKKDGLVNMGGFLALHNEVWTKQIKNLLILIEGFPTYGGLSGRDLEAIARGLREVVDVRYLAARIGQVKALGDLLTQAGVPILEPTGGHAVFLDAKRMLPHLSSSEYPAQALLCEIYREGGVRGVEIGSLMFAKHNPETGEDHEAPSMELVRLAIPRRVYTASHMAYVAETIAQVNQHACQIQGMRIVEQAPYLRHFTARLQPKHAAYLAQ